MYTSDIKSCGHRFPLTALVYLLAAIFCAVFGAVYELFSHGVYSGFMVYAFAFPLALGTLPFLLLNLALKGKNSRFLLSLYSWRLPENLYHCGILTCTVGSLMTGVLDIYGTTNRLTVFYWFAGAVLILAALLICTIGLLIKKRTSQKRL